MKRSTSLREATGSFEIAGSSIPKGSDQASKELRRDGICAETQSVLFPCITPLCPSVTIISSSIVTPLSVWMRPRMYHVESIEEQPAVYQLAVLRKDRPVSPVISMIVRTDY